jgi:hypothetical protein
MVDPALCFRGKAGRVTASLTSVRDTVPEWEGLVGFGG